VMGSVQVTGSAWVTGSAQAAGSGWAACGWVVTIYILYSIIYLFFNKLPVFVRGRKNKRHLSPSNIYSS